MPNNNLEQLADDPQNDLANQFLLLAEKHFQFWKWLVWLP